MGDIQRDPKIQVKGEKPTATLVFREFAGINTQSPRESIGDQQFGWLENAMPIGVGNMQLLTQHGASVGNFSTVYPSYLLGNPIYSATASYTGNDYIFNLTADGRLYGMNYQTGVVFLVGTGFTSGMQITEWNGLGILIIDPQAGYFDFNITAANTLTNIAAGNPGIVGSITITTDGSGYTSPPTLTLTGGGFTTPATATANLGAASATIIYGSGGSIEGGGYISHGYVVGQVITLQGGSFTTAAQLQVTSVAKVGGLNNAITGVKVYTPGTYNSLPTNPVSGSPADINNGAPTFNITWGVTGATVTTPGAGYTSAPTVTFSGGGGSGAAGVANLGAAGQVGNCIATYAGRVWIGNGRTVTYTDVASYNSFAGAGGAFTITDATLHKAITALFPTNGYLYIFGDDSIDLLSNVQVISGATTFSRINLTTSVGTTFPTSVFSYLRAIVFANQTGMWILSGSIPTKISEALDGLLPYIDFTQPVYGMPVEINGILCAGFSFFFTDTITQSYFGQYRPILAYFFNSKWFIASQLQASNAAVSVPNHGVYNQVVVDGDGNVYQAFASVSAALAIIKTKLWDDGQPILDKQVLRGGMAGVFSQGQSITFSIDSEYASYPITLTPPSGTSVLWENNASVIVAWENTFSRVVNWSNTNISVPIYYFLQDTANAANGKYMGVTITITSVATIQAIMLEYKTGARW